jgi:hypothetical protein
MRGMRHRERKAERVEWKYKDGRGSGGEERE